MNLKITFAIWKLYNKLYVNAAMFEQNGRCGYALKLLVMWNKSHPLYNRFNPFDKDTFTAAAAAAGSPTVLTVVVRMCLLSLGIGLG